MWGRHCVAAPRLISSIRGRDSAKVSTARTTQSLHTGEPTAWQHVLRGLTSRHHAAVASSASGLPSFEGAASPKHVIRFQMLVLAVLSSMTRGDLAVAALRRLVAHGLTVQDMLSIEQADLVELLRPVAFHNNKARFIKRIAASLHDQASGSDVIDIPDTLHGLLALPGVGPAGAHIVLSSAWDKTEGICVDSHVHRVANRLGWVSTWNKDKPKSQQPGKTRKALEAWLPREHWYSIYFVLLTLGQTTCRAAKPRCGNCPVSLHCPSAFQQ